MKIFYDHQIFELQNHGGISRYFYELVNNYKSSGNIDFILSLRESDNYYLSSNSFFNKIIKNKHTYSNFLPELSFYGKLKLYKALRKFRFIKDSTRVNYKFTIDNLKKQDFDIFHPTYYDKYFLNFIRNKPFVLTVFDMIHELYPEYFPSNFEFSSIRRELVLKAAKIITISESVKKDIVSILNIKEKK